MRRIILLVIMSLIATGCPRERRCPIGVWSPVHQQCIVSRDFDAGAQPQPTVITIPTRSKTNGN